MNRLPEMELCGWFRGRFVYKESELGICRSSLPFVFIVIVIVVVIHFIIVYPRHDE